MARVSRPSVRSRRPSARSIGSASSTTCTTASGRLGARCEALGITLDFQVDDDVVASFDAAQGMHVLRAIQEMVTNALRHAGASGIEVHIRSMGAAPDRIEVAVCDDGRGLVGAQNPRGRGMKSLRARARKLGGELVVEPRSPGLRVAIERPR